MEAKSSTATLKFCPNTYTIYKTTWTWTFGDNVDRLKNVKAPRRAGKEIREVESVS